MSDRQPVDLSRFDNAWYDPGRSLFVRSLWLLLNAVFLQSALPWPMRGKAYLLRMFGAKVGAGVVIKPRVNVKYPWHVSIGDHAWIGEGVWLDSLAAIEIGAHACLSQDCLVETGNHDWSQPGFDLLVRPVRIEQGAWAAARSTLLPGARLASHAVLCAGAVLAGETEPWGIYAGVPARLTGQRSIADRSAD
jgi:putative colanic acid biosynthesis acetyltransferase WcaF